MVRDCAVISSIRTEIFKSYANEHKLNYSLKNLKTFIWEFYINLIYSLKLCFIIIYHIKKRLVTF